MHSVIWQLWTPFWDMWGRQPKHCCLVYMRSSLVHRRPIYSCISPAGGQMLFIKMFLLPDVVVIMSVTHTRARWNNTDDTMLQAETARGKGIWCMVLCVLVFPFIHMKFNSFCIIQPSLLQIYIPTASTKEQLVSGLPEKLSAPEIWPSACTCSRNSRTVSCSLQQSVEVCSSLLISCV